MVVQLITIDKKNIGLVGFLVGPKIPECLFAKAEARHTVFYRFGYGSVMLKYNLAQCQQATFVGLYLIQEKTILVRRHKDSRNLDNPIKP
jgi:hypothetical protein